MKVVVIGAVAGGSTVASQIRRTVPNAEITLIGMEEKIGYGTCGMSFVIGGIVEEKRKVAGPNPNKFAESKDIRTLINHQVTSINKDEKYVTVVNLKTNEEFQESYDKLIVSTGCDARIPHYDGMETIPFFTLKRYHHMEEILDYIEREKPKSCAVVGSGFVGIELVENFVARNIDTTMVMRGDRVMAAMDEQITSILYEEMVENGVNFQIDTEIEKIEGKKLTMKNGNSIEVDFLVASIGATPNISLLEDIGITIGETKGVVVNDYMQTDDPDIYALGDIAESKDWVTGKPVRIELAWHAHRQAYIISQHLAGNHVKIKPFLGSSMIKLFSLSAGMTGLSEEILQKEGYLYETVVHEGYTNSGYYPDHGKILIRVHYHPKTRQIFGAQAVGTKGVDKRLDVIITAMMGHLTIDDLSALELNYSPPFSSPKDPVNMVGYRAK